MLTVDEIKKFIDDDKTSEKKRFAKVGERYYDGDNDIKQYRLFITMQMAISLKIRLEAT